VHNSYICSAVKCFIISSVSNSFKLITEKKEY
jgi:hypothetical protein